MAKKAAKKPAAKPAAAKDPPKAAATVTAPKESDFKTVPGAFEEDLDSARGGSSDGKSAADFAAGRSEDIANALFGPSTEGDGAATDAEDGPIVEIVDAAAGGGEATTGEDADTEGGEWEALALRGAHMGLDAETLDKFATPGALESFLNVAEVRMAKRFGELQAKGGGAETDEGDETKKNGSAKPAAKEPSSDEVGEFKMPTGDEDSLYGDGESRQVTEQLVKVANTALRESKLLRNDLEVMREQVAQMRSEYAAQQFDHMISGMGPEWEDVLGKGSLRDLSRDSDAFKARHELARTAVRLPGVLEGGESLSQQEILRRAAAGNWPEQVEKMARGKATTEVSKRRGVIKTRGRSIPTKINPEDSVSAAHAVVREFMKRKGASKPSTADQREEDLATIGL